MKINMQTNASSSISEYINKYRHEVVRPQRLGIKEVFLSDYVATKAIVMMSDSFLIKYKPELDANKNKYTLTEKEYNKYRFNMKALSYDTYGTTELVSLIKLANEVYLNSDFDTRVIYLYDTSVINKILRIIDLETQEMATNDENIQNEIQNL